MPRIHALTATPANMARLADRPGVFAYDRSTGDRWSATPGDYWMAAPTSIMREDEGRGRRVLILAQEDCRIVPAF